MNTCFQLMCYLKCHKLNFAGNNTVSISRQGSWLYLAEWYKNGLQGLKITAVCDMLCLLTHLFGTSHHLVQPTLFPTYCVNNLGGQWWQDITEDLLPLSNVCQTHVATQGSKRRRIIPDIVVSLLKWIAQSVTTHVLFILPLIMQSILTDWQHVFGKYKQKIQGVGVNEMARGTDTWLLSDIKCPHTKPYLF